MRRGEADIEMAALLGESIQIPHEEAFLTVASWFPGKLIGELKYDEKLTAAKKMKIQLASSNRQIVQILGLPPADVDRMFPIPK